MNKLVKIEYFAVTNADDYSSIWDSAFALNNIMIKYINPETIISVTQLYLKRKKDPYYYFGISIPNRTFWVANKDKDYKFINAYLEDNSIPKEIPNNTSNKKRRIHNIK